MESIDSVYTEKRQQGKVDLPDTKDLSAVEIQAMRGMELVGRIDPKTEGVVVENKKWDEVAKRRSKRNTKK